MLNIFSLICLNSVLYSSSFFVAKLPEAYAFLSPIVDFMPVIPLLFFLLALEFEFDLTSKTKAAFKNRKEFFVIVLKINKK
ncbi:Photosystem II reaction center protein K [Bienertia sinuspersici]